MERFTLEIELGNEAMRYALDVARALQEIAKRIEDGASLDGKIHDENGNTVGAYELS
jgi:hypothetical protein